MLIGIDPDVDKSGIAVKSSNAVDLMTLTFFQLFDFLNNHKEKIKTVRVEASWLIAKSNWHNDKANSRVAARIGKNAGSNHEVGRKIVEMCQYLSIPYQEVKPLKKIWKGSDGKITHAELSRMVALPPRTNQEQRDACLLIL